MIKKENFTKGLIKSLNKRFRGTMFGLAVEFGIYFDEAEIKYIETKMMTDKYYRLISGKAAGIQPGYMPLRLFQFCEIWLMKFFDDSDIPIGVKSFIVGYIGHKRAEIKIFCGMDEYNERVQQRFLSERWLEICR